VESYTVPVLDQDPLTSQIGYLLSRLGAASHAGFLAALEPLDLRPRHYGALALLHHHGPVSQQELADQMRLDRSVMVAIIDHLEHLGAVERRRDAGDRRRHALHLTDHGVDLLARCNQLIEQGTAQRLAPLTRAQREQLRELLATLVAGNPDVAGTPWRSPGA
jgi:DNA-binding MarR family transcriptional regulator